MTAAAIRRLRSRDAVHYDGDTGPMVTVKHRTAYGTAATTGRLIAETQRELALNVHGTPVVISLSAIEQRTDHRPMAVTPSA